MRIRHGGIKTIIGPFSDDGSSLGFQTQMEERNRSSSGEVTQITYRFLDDSPDDVQNNGRLVGLRFDSRNTPEQSLGGITQIGLKKDGAYYFATITFNRTLENGLPKFTTFSVDNLPVPTSSTLETYKVVDSTAANDKLFGIIGNDGVNGNDVVDGGDGNDTIKTYGGSKKEVDILTGGLGADTFVLGDRNARGQSDFGNSYQGTGHAIITDFDRGSDFDNGSGFFTSFDPTEGDKIQLLRTNNPNDYQLKYENKNIGKKFTLETTIYYKGDIIAYVQDVDLRTPPSTPLSSNPFFTFV